MYVNEFTDDDRCRGVFLLGGFQHLNDFTDNDGWRGRGVFLLGGF